MPTKRQELERAKVRSKTLLAQWFLFIVICRSCPIGWLILHRRASQFSKYRNASTRRGLVSRCCTQFALENCTLSPRPKCLVFSLSIESSRGSRTTLYRPLTTTFESSPKHPGRHRRYADQHRSNARLQISQVVDASARAGKRFGTWYSGCNLDGND